MLHALTFLSVLTASPGHGEDLAPLIMPPFAFVGIAVAVFVLLGFVVWSFRDVANRHSQKFSTGPDSHGAGH